MHAREITLLIHRDSAVDVLSALWSAGFRGVSLIDTAVHPLVATAKERLQSRAVADVTAHVRLELICETETRTAEAIALIREAAKTADPSMGRIYLGDLLTTVELGQ